MSAGFEASSGAANLEEEPEFIKKFHGAGGGLGFRLFLGAGILF